MPKVALLHPQPVFQPHWCGCELRLDALLGSTARGDSAGTTEAPRDTGMGPQLVGKGVRASLQVASREQGSSTHEVGASHRPRKKNAVSPHFPSLMAKGQEQIWGTDPMLGQNRGTVPRLRWASPLPTAPQFGRANCGPRDGAANTVGFAHR